MKKLKKFILGVLITILVLFAVGEIANYWFTYETEYKITEISEYVNPYNGYKIKFQEVGTPFLFGPSNVNVILLDGEGKVVEKIADSISDDGARAGEGNINIRWLKECVEITISGTEQSDEEYTMKYK